MKPILISIGIFALFANIGAQSSFVAKMDDTYRNNPLLDARISEYYTFEIALEDLFEYTQAGNESFYLNIGPYLWHVFLYPNDVRASGHTITVGTPQGKIVVSARKEIVTYKGFLGKGDPINMTIDRNYFSAIIEDEGNIYVIAPLRMEIEDAPFDRYIAYNVADDLRPIGGCGVSRMTTLPGEPADTPIQRDGNCYYAEFGIASSKSMVDKFGTISAVNSHNESIMNSTQANWDDEFADVLTFQIIEHYVSTSTANDPWDDTEPVDAITMLNEFTTWGNGSNWVTNPDLGIGRTAHDMDGTTVGIAWTPSSGTVACGGYEYQTHQDYTSDLNRLRQLTSHETGHNFSAGHSCENDCIMCPSINGSSCWDNPESTVPIEGGILDGANRNCFQQYTTGCSAMPVEMAYFHGFQSNTFIDLYWTTFSELENAGFAIEKSNDGKHFDQIGFEKGNGTKSSRSEYSFRDLLPGKGFNYYRLRQIDFDGSLTYLSIIVVDFDMNTNNYFNVYPNPAAKDGQLQLLGLYTHGSVHLLDTGGKVIFEKNNVSSNHLELQGIKPGIYLLRYESLADIQTIRLIIQ